MGRRFIVKGRQAIAPVAVEQPRAKYLRVQGKAKPVATVTKEPKKC